MATSCGIGAEGYIRMTKYAYIEYARNESALYEGRTIANN